MKTLFFILFLSPFIIFSMLYAKEENNSFFTQHSFLEWGTLFFGGIFVAGFLFLREQRSLKRQIQERNNAFKTLFEKSHDGILLLEDGKFTNCNEAIVKMLRYPSKQALLDLHPSRLSPEFQPDGRSSFEKAEEMMQVAIKQGYHQFHWMHTRANGENFWADIVLTKINLNGKDILHVVWRDIQKQKELEAEILHLNQELEQKVEQRTMEQNTLLSLFDKGESILFKWNNDANWSVDHVSQSIYTVLGYDKEDFLSHRIVYAKCIHPDDLPQVMKEVEEATAKNKEYFEHEPYRLYTKEGDIKWVHDSTVIVRNKKNEITHFVGYITDITDIKEKDKQLLQQSKLAQMGEMISMIAHQWRQPLTAISATTNNLSLKLMINDIQKESFLEELNLISGYTQHLSKTIDDFRKFFKENKEKERIILKDLVEETLQIVLVSLKNKNINLITEFSCDKPIFTYTSELKQVLLNFIKNAEDVLLEREIENPKITIIAKNDDTCHILIIKDNAGGIPEKIIDKIYEPYFSTKLEKDGTGLGLYMSKKIIEEHCSGKIETKNDKEGAVFKITLPDLQEN